MSNISVAEAHELLEGGVYKKLMWRILPFLLICYVASYLDRVNIGFARLQMSADLGLSEAAYGLAAGLFFLGYVLFEVPSNILLQKIGARLTFFRIMVLWGVTSAMTMFVTNPWQLNVLRFLLGAFEAGFFPGVVLYLTYWFPARKRATVVSWFFVGAAISGIIGGPLSGWIISTFSGVHGLKGWQWLFLLEAIPSVLLGFAAFFFVADNPGNVKWLTPNEKRALKTVLDAETEHSPHDAASVREALKGPAIYFLVFLYFAIVSGCYGISFWLPVMIRDSGVKDVFVIGMYSAVPWTIGAFGIVFLSMWSDKIGNRRIPLALCTLVGAGALGAMAYFGQGFGLLDTIVALSIAIAVIYAAVPIFWSLPPMYLSTRALSVAIAIISSLGSLGGFISPYVIGLVTNRTGRASDGLYVIVGVLVMCAIAIMIALPARDRIVPAKATA
ncbi:putative MFS-type transporter (plasmid) [Cupriavidus sp. U2]|uniref:MFS transporter n=1 Tax=Cupriavidus sp. U2 TaxID=2920269 RepID=UPI00129EB391|nr:MFS transporter [Cupriavidus sp. U2]KAI3593392.1 putative MFS-type transporter [Cupriavidus sp. U2]